MTDHFEVVDRDGPARLGELRLADPVTTPALVDDHLVDAGSLWARERAVPEPGGSGEPGADDVLTVLPHRAFPAGTRDPVQESFGVAPRGVDYPAAAVVASDAVDAHEESDSGDGEEAADGGAVSAGGGDAGVPVDAYVLSDLPGVVGHASGVVDAVTAAREALPDDVALCVSGVATPATVAVLAYAGIDCFDASRARTKGLQGRYLTTDGERWLDDLTELPCACPACQGGREAFDRAACADHNVAALAAEVARVRRRIREGRLRDYVEGQARHEPWLTATVRELDQQWGYLEERTPVVRGSGITAASEETMDRVEIRRFADRVTSRYRPRLDDHPLVLLPCSATKPYAESQSHRQFREAIGYRGHVVSTTSPIGVVPRELELTYPAQHYDSVVTGEWTEGEVDFVARVLSRYLDRADYDRAIAHVPPDYRPIVERAAAGRDLPVEYTVVDHPTTAASLSNLREALSGAPSFRKRRREAATVRAIADYQFAPTDDGRPAGDGLFGSISTTGRFPKLQVRDDDGNQLAALVPRYGVLSLTIAGARRWIESPVPTRRVAIDDFVPHGSVLCPGVVDADDAIRPGDEVVIEGPAALAVGRATVSGPAMVDATRGVCCDVRHVVER